MKIIIVLLAIIAYVFTAQYAVLMKEQVDFKNLKHPFTDKLLSELDFSTRGRVVIHELKRVAEISQRHVKQLLDLNHVQYKSFWMTNSIIIPRPTESILNLLQAREDVKKIEKIDDIKMIDDKGYDAEKLRDIEWNIAQIKAPQTWMKGYTGQGVVVALLDTGVNYKHKDVKEKYRGYNGGNYDHQYNWFDGVTNGICKKEPCDQNGHGSHVIGTIVGDSGIGVAPGAKFVACRSFATGGATIQDIMNCFEWYAEPTKTDGTEGDSDKRPHVINHSWGAGARYEQLERAIDALHAVGSLQVFAAGNSGSRCSTLLYPGQYTEVLTVGAQDYQKKTIAYFSSRGPAKEGTYVKPDVVAPGTQIKSCSNVGDGYRQLSGTSMATPHVVGSVALLFSAKPHLIGQIEKTIETVQMAAEQLKTTECTPGKDFPNYVYGYGQVDNLKQVE